MSLRPAFRRSGRLLVPATLAAVVLAVASAAPPAARGAAPSLTLVGRTSYAVQPDRHRVHVTVDLTVTNRTTETITSQFVFDRANLAVLPGSTGFRATDDGVKVAVGIASRSATSTLLTIQLAKRLSSGRSTALHLAFELPDPGGSPARLVRVGPSLLAFPVWAFGSPGVPGSSVAITVPAGYKVTVPTGRLGRPTTAADGTTTITSGSLADPATLSAYVLGDRPGAYREVPVDVVLGPTTARLAIRAWTDDPSWARKTANLLKRALPALATAIGLPYPRTTTVVVEEAVARSIDGQAGVYDPASGTLRIAYTTPAGSILRAVAHLWFDGRSFADRWIVEGLASHAAIAAAAKLKLASAPPGGGVLAGSGFPLNAWVPSADVDTAADAYGYAASAELVRQVEARTGPGGLQAVLAAVATRSTADPIDWRGLLDLIQSQTGVDASDLWRTYVVRPDDAALLDARSRVHFQRDALAAEANGWALPAGIDAALAAWRFDDAESAINQAQSVLRARDDLAVAAAVAGLDLPTNLRDAFETGDPDAAAAEARIERAIVDQIVAAQAAGAASSSSWLVRVGLLGQDPFAQLVAARVAFREGDLAAAQARAIGAREMWAGAADLGGLRLRGILALLLVVAVGLLFVATRSRRRPREWYETGT